MSEQLVIVDVKATEFVDGDEANTVTVRVKGTQEFVPLVARLLSAMSEEER